MAESALAWHHGSFNKPARATMHSVRHIKAVYFAAFLLGAIIAFLVAAPLRAAESGFAPTGQAGEWASKAAPDAYS